MSGRGPWCRQPSPTILTLCEVQGIHHPGTWTRPPNATGAFWDSGQAGRPLETGVQEFPSIGLEEEASWATWLLG